jgi:hypothetical protein
MLATARRWFKKMRGALGGKTASQNTTHTKKITTAIAGTNARFDNAIMMFFSLSAFSQRHANRGHTSEEGRY